MGVGPPTHGLRPGAGRFPGTNGVASTPPILRFIRYPSVGQHPSRGLVPYGDGVATHSSSHAVARVRIMAAADRVSHLVRSASARLVFREYAFASTHEPAGDGFVVTFSSGRRTVSFSSAVSNIVYSSGPLEVVM